MHAGSSSLTRDQTQAPCIGSAESYPLDHQGGPQKNINYQNGPSKHNYFCRCDREHLKNIVPTYPPSPKYQTLLILWRNSTKLLKNQNIPMLFEPFQNTKEEENFQIIAINQVLHTKTEDQNITTVSSYSHQLCSIKSLRIVNQRILNRGSRGNMYICIDTLISHIGYNLKS